jgi:uncharacterized repeat protein (TIGR01451 family)
MIDIAIGPDGEMYGHDIGTDSIYHIDKATANSTLIGPTGYAANYAQGMDFDNDDGTLYIFLYQGTGANVYGTVNLTTGAVTPLAISNPQGEFEGAIPLPGSAAGLWIDVPWVSEVPTDGLTLPYDALDVDVVFDTHGLTAGECYTAALGLFHDDPGWDSPTMIPLDLCVQSSWPVFGITKTVEAPNPYPGETVTYTVAFGNDGDAVVGVTVSDSLPSEVAFAWSSSGTYDPVAHELVWGPMGLGAGEWMTATVVATIGVDVMPGTELMNMVYLTWEDQEHSAGAMLDVQEPFRYYYLPMIYKNATP